MSILLENKNADILDSDDNDKAESFQQEATEDDVDVSSQDFFSLHLTQSQSSQKVQTELSPIEVAASEIVTHAIILGSQTTLSLQLNRYQRHPVEIKNVQQQTSKQPQTLQVKEQQQQQQQQQVAEIIEDVSIPKTDFHTFKSPVTEPPKRLVLPEMSQDILHHRPKGKNSGYRHVL